MPSPIANLKKSMRDVIRLLAIHAQIGGTEQGRRYGIEVLNKSAVIFAAAAWEAFVEDIATQAIDHILSEAADHSSIPLPIRKAAAKGLEDDQNELKVWELADDGWKAVVISYRDEVIRDNISTFNTPKPHNVDALLKKLLGIEKISSNWKWQGMSATSASTKLRKFIETRGAVAHRGDLQQSITRAYVNAHLEFIVRLSIRTSNIVRTKVRQQSGSFPWPSARYRNFR